MTWRYRAAGLVALLLSSGAAVYFLASAASPEAPPRDESPADGDGPGTGEMPPGEPRADGSMEDGFVEHFDVFPSKDIWSANAQDVSRITIIKHPVRQGAGAIKLTVFPKDVSATKNRAEINLVYGDKPKTGNWRDVWYAWSVMVPADYFDDQENPRFQIMGQFHVVPEFQKGETWEDYPKVPPMICFRYGYDKGGPGFGLFYGLMSKNKSPARIAKTYIKKGVWYDVTLHIRWSASKEGFVEAWLNDEPLTPWNGKDHKYYGPNMYNTAPPMLKFGLYRDWGFKTVNSVYYDELRIGHRREDVRVPGKDAPQDAPSDR